MKRSGVLTVAALLVLVGAAPHAAAAPKYPWGKDPGPIGGKWKPSCANSSGMVIEIAVDGAKAVGKVRAVGAAKKYGYKDGEEILKLEADDYGDWVGRVHYRAVDGSDRWDPIRMVATPDELNATMTFDDCFKKMTHG